MAASRRCFELRSEAARYPGQLENAAGNLLDRTMRGIDVRHAKACVHALGRAQFVLYLLRRGVTALRAPHLAYLLQPRGLDRQAKQLARVRTNCISHVSAPQC